MGISITGYTDVGLIRTNNEDHFLINKTIMNEGSYSVELQEDQFLVAIADGMGGAQSGEIASKICLEHLSNININSVDQLREELLLINEKIIQYGKDNKESFGLGSTVAGLIVLDHVVYTFHVGDSRVYRYRKGYVSQITKDHSYVQVLFETGKITREEMYKHPESHILLQSLGGNEQKLEPSIEPIKGSLLPKDVYLLCSDGLSDLVSVDEIENILSTEDNLSKKGENLIHAAKIAGGTDNISVILLEKQVD